MKCTEETEEYAELNRRCWLVKFSLHDFTRIKKTDDQFVEKRLKLNFLKSHSDFKCTRANVRGMPGCRQHLYQISYEQYPEKLSSS